MNSAADTPLSRKLFAVFALLGGFCSSAWGENESLFRPMPRPLVSLSSRTLVFWINGDADHFVTQGNGDQSGKLFRADKFEVARILSAAESCHECTTVILHDQRGSDGFLKRARPWATYLRVFHGGKRILERSASEVNMADPNLLTQLLKFSRAINPKGEISLIYRGHPILPPGAPEGDAPFDYSHPQDRFSANKLALAIFQARLGTRLGTVILASCGSAYLETAVQLKTFAKFMVAAQHPVIERLSVSFSFDGIFARAEKENARGFSENAAGTLMERFYTAQDTADYSYEYSITLIDLDQVSTGTAKSGLDRIESMTKTQRARARTIWMKSDRARSNDEMNRVDPFAYDCGKSFSEVGLRESFRRGIAPAVQVWNQSRASNMSGLNCVGQNSKGAN